MKEKIKLQLPIDKELHKKLYIQAIINEVTPSHMLEIIIKNYFQIKKI